MGILLENKIFISTRPAGQNNELQHLLEKEGASLLEMPTIEIQAAQLSSLEKKVFEKLERYTWIVFTSPNGIHFFFEKLKELQGNYQIPHTVKIAVIGQKTAEILTGFGHHANLSNPGNTSIELGTELMRIIDASDHLLFPEGDLAMGKIKQMLALVSRCTRIVVYRTTMPQTIDQEILNRIIKNQYDQIIVTSPSGFINLVEVLKENFHADQLKVSCIGTTTAQAVKAKACEPKLTARMSNAVGIVNELCEYYKIKK